MYNQKFMLQFRNLFSRIKKESIINIICQHHQYGYFKFGEKCRLFHTPHTCNTCDKVLCTSRHPKPCKYHTPLNTYHILLPVYTFITIHPLHLKNIKETFKNILKSISAKQIQIDKFKRRIQELDKRNMSVEDSSIKFKYDKCKNVYNTRQALRTNMIKHMQLKAEN